MRGEITSNNVQNASYGIANFDDGISLSLLKRRFILERKFVMIMNDGYLKIVYI